MLWSELRRAIPNRWVIVEALSARTESGRRELDDLALLETCPDGAAAFRRYRALHLREPARELYALHTSNEQPKIEERAWAGIRL